MGELRKACETRLVFRSLDDVRHVLPAPLAAHHLNMNRATRYTATDGRPHNIVKDDAKNILKDIT